MKEKDNLGNIQTSIQNEAVAKRIATIVGKKKISNKKLVGIIASENLKYEAIRKGVTEMVMGKKETNTSEALRKTGFNIIEETKYFGSDPTEKQEIKKEDL